MSALVTAYRVEWVAVGLSGLRQSTVHLYGPSDGIHDRMDRIRRELEFRHGRNMQISIRRVTEK